MPTKATVQIPADELRALLVALKRVQGILEAEEVKLARPKGKKS